MNEGSGLLKGRERFFALDDGLRGTLEEWGVGGPPLLCVHGMTSSRKGWTRLAGRFSAERRVFACDQRGHGDLADVTGPMTLEQSVRDLESATRAIGDPVDLLLGHSWGGAVVLCGGPRTGARAVVALDPVIRVRPGTFAADYVEELRDLLSLDRDDRIPRIRELYAKDDPLDREAKVHAMERMSVAALERIGSDNGVEEGRWDLRPLLASYPLPLLVLLSGEDSVVDPEDRQWLEGLGGSVRVRTIEGAGHNLHRTHLDRVVEEIRAFERVAFGESPA